MTCRMQLSMDICDHGIAISMKEAWKVPRSYERFYYTQEDSRIPSKKEIEIDQLYRKPVGLYFWMTRHAGQLGIVYATVHTGT
jgi:hypothetical protein